MDSCLAVATDCVFCLIARGETPIGENGPVNKFFDTHRFFGIFDKFPVNDGHALIIPKRHVVDIFDLNYVDWEDLYSAVHRVKSILDRDFQPEGYNIGMNCGESAGQTVFHCHLHIIPRYKGDVENPRGGICRNKMPTGESLPVSTSKDAS